MPTVTRAASPLGTYTAEETSMKKKPKPPMKDKGKPAPFGKKGGY